MCYVGFLEIVKIFVDIGFFDEIESDIWIIFIFWREVIKIFFGVLVLDDVILVSVIDFKVFFKDVE